MGVPIMAVECVGDMSEPSVLCNQVSSISPRSHLVMAALVEEYKNALDGEEEGTVKKIVSPIKKAGAQNSFSLGQGRDLFSSHSPRRTISTSSVYKPCEISTGSPTQVEPVIERLRRKSFPRPRIATETFESLTKTVPNSSSKVPIGSTETQTSDNYNWTQARQRAGLPPSAHALHFSPSSVYSQSDESESSHQEFFTPPSTCRDKGKEPQRFTSLRKSAIGFKSATRQVPLHKGNPPTSRTHRQETSGTIVRKQRQATITSQNAPSTPDTRRSFHLQPTPRNPHTDTTPPPLTPFSTRTSLLPLSSSTSLYSCSTPLIFHRSTHPVDGAASTPSSTPDMCPNAVGQAIEKRFRLPGRGGTTTAITLCSDEVRKLRDDSEVLKKDLKELKEEFRAWKDELLGLGIGGG